MTVGKHTTPEGIEICYEIFGEENNVPPIVLISGAGLQMLSGPKLIELITEHVLST